MKLKEFGPPGELGGSKYAIFDKQIPRNNTKINEMNETCTYFQPIGKPPDTNSNNISVKLIHRGILKISSKTYSMTY